MIKQLAVLTLAATLSSGVVPSFADDAVPKALAPITGGGYTIGRHFDAGHGLTGWVISRGGQSNIVFTTGDGDAVIMGSVIDTAGHNLSSTFASQYIVKTDLKPVYADLEKTTYITERGTGPAKRIVYIVFDPNCPYCSIAWKTLRPHLAEGLEVRWVPVAYLQADSGTKVAALLGAKDPAAALEANEQGFNVQTHEGGIVPASTIPSSVAAALKQNDDIMSRLGSSATPTFVWMDANHTIQSQVGLPEPLRMLEIVGIGAESKQ